MEVRSESVKELRTVPEAPVSYRKALSGRFHEGLAGSITEARILAH